MAEVVSVSVPGELHKRWKSSGKQISPSTLFQTALETELDNTNRHLVYWSQRALNAEKKLKMITSLIEANDSDIKNVEDLEGKSIARSKNLSFFVEQK